MSNASKQPKETTELVGNILKDLQTKKSHKFDVSLLSDENSPCVVTDWLSTGCLALDTIMGGGLPYGRITEIYGDNSTGKSLIASQCAAVAQQDSIPVVYVDSETAVSLAIMEAVGVDTDNLIYSSPDTIEDVFDLFESAIIAKVARSKNSKMLVIWDSIAATSSRLEMDSDYGKSAMGRHAQLLSQGLRKFARQVSKENVAVLFLNQTREKIGVMFGDNVTTFGGKAVGFYASIRIQLKMGHKIKEGGKIVGIESRAQVVKNKLAPPYLCAALPIFFGHGIDDELASFYYLKDAKLLEQSGSWYRIEGIPDKFQLANWSIVYDKNYQLIAKLISESQIIDSTDDVEDIEEDKATED
ncbi:MAG: ATPase domain-containing protein [Candidatus Izemoplasmatales bacterium]